MRKIKMFEDYVGASNANQPKYNVGDYVEIFHVMDDEILIIEEVIEEEGFEPKYRCKFLFPTDITGEYYEAEECQINRKLRDSEISALKFDM